MPPPARSTLIAYAAIAVVVVALGLRWLDRDAQTAVPDSSLDAAPASTSESASGARKRDSAVALPRAPAPRLVVHVVGAVRSPGVYRLREGSRVADAVKRAGGVARGADTAAVNLAAKLTDGQQVVLPRRAAQGAIGPAPAAGGAAAPAQGGAGSAPGPISLASATLEQLDTLDGVGPATAKKILDWRAKTGGFSSVDDLAEIPGIGPKKLESLRAQVVP